MDCFQDRNDPVLNPVDSNSLLVWCKQETLLVRKDYLVDFLFFFTISSFPISLFFTFFLFFFTSSPFFTFFLFLLTSSSVTFVLPFLSPKSSQIVMEWMNGLKSNLRGWRVVANILSNKMLVQCVTWLLILFSLLLSCTDQLNISRFFHSILPRVNTFLRVNTVSRVNTVVSRIWNEWQTFPLNPLESSYIYTWFQPVTFLHALFLLLTDSEFD